MESEARMASSVAADARVAPWETKGAATELSSPGGDDSEIGRLKTSLEKMRKMFLVTALEGARRVSFEANELCIEFAPDTRHLHDMLAKNVKILQEVCKEITRRNLGVRFVITDGKASDVPTSEEETERREKQRLRETAEKDPVVQQMLRTFRGEVVDVKRLDSEQSND